MRVDNLSFNHDDPPLVNVSSNSHKLSISQLDNINKSRSNCASSRLLKAP